MKKVGLTGGIGSGKTTVARILETLGFPVYYSDDRAKELMRSNPEIRDGLISIFGQGVYQNGELNRPFLAGKIFQDEELKAKVNALVHPVVREDFDRWSQSINSAVVFNEAAILFETGAYKRMDLNVLVSAPKELRISRVINRDQISEQEVTARINNQWPDEEKIKLADYVLINDDRNPLLDQIDLMLDQITKRN